MRAVSVAMFAVVAVILAVLAIQGADAHYIRFYYDNTACTSSSSSLWFLGTSTSCQSPWNNTQTKTNTGSFKLSKCNATTGKFSFDAYSQVSCSGGSFQSYNDAAADTCVVVGPGSMRVVCSAGAIAFSAVAVIAAVLALLL